MPLELRAQLAHAHRAPPAAGSVPSHMPTLLALLFILLCIGCIAYAAARVSGLSIFLATLALFSIGYYGLPMLLLERSTLRYLPEAEVTATIAMALLFMIAVVCGFAFTATRRRVIPAMNFVVLDVLLARHWWPGSIISSATILYYNTSRTLTFYQMESVEAYFDSISIVAGIVGFFALLAQAFTAVYLVQALRERDLSKIAFSLASLLLQLATVVSGANRLLFITPLILVMGAMLAGRNFRMAGGALTAIIAGLLIYSPFAVAMRAGSWNNTQDVQASTFSFGANPIDTVLQSIVDRGDILNSMATLKSYVDSNGRVGPQYYYSVLVIPVPRYFYPNKPAVLSADGTRHTEASILAWHLTVGPSIGSLTAFGAIVAYREGGWLWVAINGMLAGCLFAALLGAFSRGGFIAQGFFALTFLSWSVRKVPPSLMEAMADVMTYLPVIAALYFLNRLLDPNRSARAAAVDAASLPHVQPV